VNSLLRILLEITGLTAVFLLMLASDSWADALVGVVISFVVLFTFRGFLIETQDHEYHDRAPSLITRIMYFPLFLIMVLKDVTVGTWQVLGYSLGWRKLDRSGIITVPIGDCTPTGVSILAIVTTLAPGSALVDIDWAEGQMLVHVIDASDPEAVRHAHRHFYERYQKKVFP
jgi:multicomponent Na+:H+ antiporter subunit E